MRVAIRRILAVFTLTVAPVCSASLVAQDCAQDCLVQIEGLQPVYFGNSTSNLVIRNNSKDDLDLNVAVEGFEDGSWIELTGSISEPRNAFSKTKLFRTVAAGSSLEMEFSPCDIRILRSKGGHAETPNLCTCAKQGEKMPSLLRLRIDVFSRKKKQIVQRVRSKEFRFEI